MDIENNHTNFIHLDLGSLGELFGDDSMWSKLDELPSPDIILCSPPCEAYPDKTIIPKLRAPPMQIKGW